MTFSGAVAVILGLSGVGKSRACQAFVSKHPEFLYFRASSLLKEVTGMPSELLRTASSDVVARNQSRLGAALDLKRTAQTHKPVLIDAHNIIDNDRELIRVPNETFSSLNPSGIIFLEAEPHEIKARREADTRVRPVRSIEELEAQQKLSKCLAQKCSVDLKIPLFIQRSGDSLRFVEAVKTICL